MRKLLITAAATLALAACATVQPHVEKSPQAEGGAAMLIGKWSSTDDRNFIREFKEDGTVVDSYANAEGETTTNGKWYLFSKGTGKDTPYPLEEGALYIKQVDDDGTTLYFHIITITPESLELIYLDRGGVLRFGKMTTGHELQDGEE